jgi:hypothetical protein
LLEINEEFRVTSVIDNETKFICNLYIEHNRFTCDCDKTAYRQNIIVLLFVPDELASKIRRKIKISIRHDLATLISKPTGDVRQNHELNVLKLLQTVLNKYIICLHIKAEIRAASILAVVKRSTVLSFSSMLQKPRSNIIFSKIV